MPAPNVAKNVRAFQAKSDSMLASRHGNKVAWKASLPRRARVKMQAVEDREKTNDQIVKDKEIVANLDHLIKLSFDPKESK